VALGSLWDSLAGPSVCSAHFKFLHSDGLPRISELFIAGVRINELNKLLARLACSLIFRVNDS
jgi:hypothetical protein